MNINNFTIATPGEERSGAFGSGALAFFCSSPRAKRLYPPEAHLCSVFLRMQCIPPTQTLGAGTPRFPVQWSQGLFLGLGGPFSLAHLLKKGLGVCLGVGGRGQGTGSEGI